MEKDLIVSVSGIRGVYGAGLDGPRALALGTAFGLFRPGVKVYLGTDTRPSGDALKHAFAAGLLEAGNDVADLGTTPTPTDEFVVEKNPGNRGAVITASHNPQEYNGIKLLGGTGTFLDETEFAEFLALYRNASRPRAAAAGKMERCPDPFDAYAKALYALVDARAIRKRKFRVVVDPCNGVGALSSRRFLEGLGCEVTMINDAPPGIFAHDPEPKAAHLADLLRAVPAAGADIGFAQDPDGDRLVMVDERGTAADEERGVAVLLGHLVARAKKKDPVVVVNHSTTSLVEYVCERLGAKVVRSRVGEAHVVAAMRKTGAVAAGEGSGGIIFPEFHAGRDSFAGMALALEFLALNRTGLSETFAGLPPRSLVKERLALPRGPLAPVFARIETRFPGARAVREDGLKLITAEGWVHVRPSNTEPVVRIYAEADDEDRARRLCEKVRELISGGRSKTS